ncbi:hypothetical protein [Lignipirellula cremea]|uniref:hypothetical protein n=1 Tax=Lignipirellula cremea TaxID=2528010 RepID=UPI0011AA3936|nr:hypothetical protein [Lignipirellula cremea]
MAAQLARWLTIAHRCGGYDLFYVPNRTIVFDLTEKNSSDQKLSLHLLALKSMLAFGDQFLIRPSPSPNAVLAASLVKATRDAIKLPGS